MRFRVRSASTTGHASSAESASAIVLLPEAIVPPTHTSIGSTTGLRVHASASKNRRRASAAARRRVASGASGSSASIAATLPRTQAR
jgi:hypothetical protein